MLASKKRSETTTFPAASAGRITSSTSCARLAMYSSISARRARLDRRAVEQDLAEPVAQRRPPGVAAGDDLVAPRAEPVGQPGRLGRLAAAVGAVQGQEEAPRGDDAVAVEGYGFRGRHGDHRSRARPAKEGATLSRRPRPSWSRPGGSVGLTASKRTRSICSIPRAIETFQTWTSPASFLSVSCAVARPSIVATLTTIRPPGAEPGIGGAQDQADLPAGAADEDGVGLGQRRQDLGGAPGDRPDVGHAERLGVGLDQRDVGRLGLDRVDHPLVGELRRLDRHRARAGADVPDDARRPDVELRQGDRADLGLGDQPALGQRLREGVVGVAEEPVPARAARPVGPVRACGPGSGR